MEHKGYSVGCAIYFIRASKFHIVLHFWIKFYYEVENIREQPVLLMQIIIYGYRERLYRRV